jgi:hypothetical protein
MLEIKDKYGQRLQVAERDFETVMDWDSAKKACLDLGNGWRLPSMDELISMHEQLHKKGKGNFKTGKKLLDEDYWSSELFVSITGCVDKKHVYVFTFNGAIFNTSHIEEGACVRAVRDL